MQLEVPLPTIQVAVEFAKSRHVKTVLNAAPAPTRAFEDAFLKQIDYLLVNETEAGILAGKPVKDLDSAYQVAQSLQKKTGGVVILTLGEKGAVTADSHSCWLTPAFKVNAVDTTAAGDAFTGGLVAALQRGVSLKDAAVYGNASGALAASKFGAQPSLPTLEEVQAFLNQNQAG